MDISLRSIAGPGVNKASDIAKAKGQKWPPPPTISVRDWQNCQPPIGVWENFMKTQAFTPAQICSPTSVEDIIALVKIAERNQEHVHAVGSSWSFSDCFGVLDDARLVNVNTNLNKEIQTVRLAMTSGDPTHVYHAQAGMTIQAVYRSLEAMGLALETMGGASGQTLVGAISTGTHGGDIFLGGLADSVLAIHMIGAGGVEYWIEPSSGITDPALLRQHVSPTLDPANVIYDDSWFNAALVSIGCMGIIYAVVLRVRDQYNLVETTTLSTWRNFLSMANNLLEGATVRFLQVAVCPYPDGNGDNACLITTRNEGESASNLCFGGDPAGPALDLLADLVKQNAVEAAGLGVDQLTSLIQGGSSEISSVLIQLINGVLSKAPDLRSVLARHYPNFMAAIWPPGTCGGNSFAVMDTNRRGKGTNNDTPGLPPTADSIEMFFQALDENGRMPWISFVETIMNTINSTTSTFLAGYVSLRFCAGTRASLGMERFNQNCCVEISALQGITGQRDLMKVILDTMYSFNGLPHWGQLIDLGIQGSGEMYPGYQGWRSVYGKMSNNFAQRTFENALSVRWKLTTP